jgi:hypothetical protein
MLSGCFQTHIDDETRDDDGIQVRPVYRHNPIHVNRPSIYKENLSDNEDYAKRLFKHNGEAVQRGVRREGVRCGGARYRSFERGGVGFGKDDYEGAGYRGLYDGHLMCQDYIGGESNEYRMKIDLPPFNRHLHIEDFLD